MDLRHALFNCPAHSKTTYSKTTYSKANYSKATGALWLCMLLVVACASGAQISFSRTTGFQPLTLAPVASVSSQDEKCSVARSQAISDADDGACWQVWQASTIRVVEREIDARVRDPKASIAGALPPIRAPPQV